MMTTKEMISDYLKRATNSIVLDELSEFTTNAICEELFLSRSLTSGYLNELLKAGELVKINSRPVYYFNKQELESKYSIFLKLTEYGSVDELFNCLNVNKKEADEFERITGYDGSLQEVIRQIKISLSYPPRGLDMILSGEKGNGKRLIVESALKYATNNNLVEQKDIYKFSVSKNNPDIEEAIFGSEKSTSIFERVQNGIIVIANVEQLSVIHQDFLAQIIRTESIEIADRKEKLTSLLILISHNPCGIISTLQDAIPMNFKIPSFKERPIRERENLVIKDFYRELGKIYDTIKISKFVIDKFVNGNYCNNIVDLKNLVKSICAGVYSKHKDKKQIQIRLSDLLIPPFNITNIANEKEDEYINIKDYFEMKENSSIIQIFNEILAKFKELNDNDEIYKFFGEMTQVIRQYYEYLMFEESYLEHRIKSISNAVNEILDYMKRDYDIVFSYNYVNILSKMIYSNFVEDKQISNWDNQNKELIDELFEYVLENYNEEYFLAKRIDAKFQKTFDYNLSKMNLIFLILNIKFYNSNRAKNYSTLGIIICHGYQTASSMADAANTILRSNIFEAFDMKLDDNSKSIALKIDDYLAENPYYENIIVLVDMGSLEDILSIIKNYPRMTIGILNNVSTALAIEVGGEIIQNTSISEIISCVVNDYKISYQIKEKEEKKSVIVVLNDTSMRVSNKIIKLLENSLPKKIDLKFLEYDYYESAKDDFKKKIIDLYDVLLVIKPSNIDLKDINSIELEEIVNSDKHDNRILKQVFRRFLNSDEYDIFNQNIIKNFSLQNVMENLIILNPNKLMDFVYDAVSNFQKELELTLSNKKLTGMYMHICLAIERLVTKNEIHSEEELVNRFVSEQPHFIRVVNDSFDTINKYYNVVLPMMEIILLYNYVFADSGEEGYF